MRCGRLWAVKITGTPAGSGNRASASRRRAATASRNRGWSPQRRTTPTSSPPPPATQPAAGLRAPAGRRGTPAGPELEDVPGPPPGARQAAPPPRGGGGAGPRRGGGVEFPGDRPPADPAPRLVGGDAPVHAD